MIGGVGESRRPVVKSVPPVKPIGSNSYWVRELTVHIVYCILYGYNESTTLESHVYIHALPIVTASYIPC